jgi:hypothetical protein
MKRSILHPLAVLAAAMLANCEPPRAPPAPAQPVTPGPSCSAVLMARGAIFEPAAERVGPGACRLSDAVSLARGSSATLVGSATLNCAIALRWTNFEMEVLQPAAQLHFGRPLLRVRHFGGYSCRGRSGDSRRLSEHALGNAFDISGFEIENGPVILVERAWRDRGPEGRFLRDIAHRSCRHFNIVLTPNSDAAHRTHFHFDLGPYKRCDA